MAFKDLLQSQKTIRELKTETAALRLEKAEAARQKEQLEAHAAAVSREADREAAGRQREQTEAVEAAQRALFEAMRPPAAGPAHRPAGHCPEPRAAGQGYDRDVCPGG